MTGDQKDVLPLDVNANQNREIGKSQTQTRDLSEGVAVSECQNPGNLVERKENSRQEAGFGPVTAGMEAAVSGVEVGLNGHEEEGAYDAGAEVEVGQRCADVARE